MNSFRVINARFRILKGGKIGLSLSVFLLGGMITLSKTNALATDYFTDVKVDTVGAPTSTAGTYGTAEVQERTTSGSVTATRNDAAYGSVVFKPDSWGTYYTGVTSSTDIDTNGDSNPDSTKFNFTTESSNALTLTFSSGSNAGSISKDTTTIHSVNLNTDTITGNATNSYDSLAISGSTDYTANLIFDGSNNVSGATNIGDGNMYFGGNANFSGTVNAGSINVDTTSKIVFNSDVDLSAGTNNSLTFDSAGTVEFKSDLTGDITSSGQGTVTFVGDGSGKAQTITGNIGSSVGTGIDTLNVGESGVSNNYSTLTVNGDVYATNTVLNNGTGSSTLILSDGSNITSSITTADDDKGRLSLNGNSTVTGTVGALGTELEKITVSGAVGTVSSISGDVHALTTEIGANELQLGSNLTGNINASVSGQGTLTLAGDSVGKAQLITGDIGNLATINVGNASNITDYSTSTIDGDISATNIVLNNNSELILKKDGANVTSAITTNDGNGTLTVQKDATISGQVGTGAVGGALNVINAGTTVSDVVVFESGVYATTTNITDGRVDFNTVSGNTETNIVFNGTGEANLHGNLTGDITSSGQGTVTFVGDGSGKAQTITGNIGSSVGTGIDTLNVGESGVSNNYSTLTVNGDVYATNTVLNNGTGSSTLILSDGSNITSSITTADDDKGILSLNGNSTVTGTVGALGTELEKITVSGAVGTVSSISGDVHALTTEIGANELQLGSNLTGNINASVSGQGTLTLAGDSVGKAQLITGDIGNLATINVGNASNITDYSTSTIDGDISATNIVLNNNSELILKKDGANVTSAITTNDGNGTLTVQKDATISGQVGTGAVGGALNVINAGTTVSDVVVFESGVYATTTNITDGRVDFNTVSGNTETNIVFNGTGEANLHGNLTGDITSSGQGTVTFVGDGSGKAQTITGNIGSSVGTGIDTLNVGESGVSNNYSTLTVNGDVYATNTVLNNGTGSSTLILSDGSNITSSITTADDDKGILSLNGNSTVTGTVGDSSKKLKEINVTGTGGTVSSISGDVHALTTEIGANELQLGSNLTGNINASVSGQGTLTLAGDSVGKAQLITGDIGNLATINVGNASNITDYSTSTIDGDISATNIVLNNNSELILKKDGANVTSAITTNDGNGTLTVQKDATISGQVGTGAVGGALNVINAGTTASDVVVFESGVYATNTNITAGRVDFNKVSGTTTSNIIFNGTGEANLYGDLTGDINFAGYDATVNVKDGKGILGSVDTLTNNNTGILNYDGDGTIDGVIGSASLGIGILNINTNNEQDTPDGVKVTYSALGREIYADTINLRNNATFTLSDGVDLIDSGTDNIIIKVDANNTGKLKFEGTSTIDGEVGESNNILNTILVGGASGKTVTFNDMVYASILNYSDDGTVVLNGKNNLDVNKEGFIGTIDLANTTGTLEIGDGVNLTVDSSGIQFANANDATLKFEGDTTVYGVLGGNEAGNSKFEEIYAGLNGKTATFKNDVYVEENTFHVGNGTVNFEGDLISSLIFDADGIVNMSDGKSVIVSSSAQSIKTSVDGEGTVNFEGATTLYGDIGYVDATNSLNNKLLSSVTFGSVGTSSNSYNQDIDKNVYALNTYIGNGSNKTTLNIKEDITFGGNLNLRKDSVLNVSDYNVTVDNNLDIASNATLNFKVNATDLEGLASSTYGNYGSINSTSLTIDNDSEIHISYVGTLNGTDTYDLIRTSNIILTNYEGTELNGLVSDDSIVNSVVKNVGNNLVLFVDRTGGGSFAAEDLYIVKSGIGKDYSNGASQLLAGYANDTQRAGALTDIVRKMEYFEGGTDVSQAKKDEMIAIQRKLTPISNSSNIQTAVTSTNLATTTIGSRLSDIRRTETNNFTPNIYSGNYAGLSSGDYGYDTSFWVKGMGSKATQDNVKDYYGYDTTTYGFVAGMDKTMHDGTIFGIAVGYSDTKTNQDNADSDSSNTNSVQATIYSSKEFGDTYLDGYLSYSKHTTDGTRTANSGKVTSSVDSDQISAKVESGHKFRVNDGISVTPFASLEYSLLNQKGYTEKGSTYQNDALKVDGLKLNRGTVEVGAKLTSNIELEDTLIIPQFTASVYNSFGDNKADVKAQFVGGGNKFATPVQELNQTMVNVGVGVETKISDSTSLIFDIEHDRSRDGSFEAYSGSVTFGVSF